MATLFRNARLVGAGVERGDLRAAGGVIDSVGPSLTPRPDDEIVDLAGRVLMPGFVDCHTHACWAGSRLEEWEAKLRGEAYLDILGRGGGIMATVRAVRAATVEDLAGALLSRLGMMLACGTTTAEVKSGYGLDTATELKMLDAIAAAAGRWAGTLVPTACIAHAIDPDRSDFVRRTIDETLPAVTGRYPGIAVDGYCERGAWPRDACIELAERATAAGHPVRMHADQFTSLGFVEWAASDLRVRSVDHLEATPDGALKALAHSPTFGVLLPASGFHLDGRYADGRRLLDHGGKLAIASNYNPGSAPCGSMPMTIALAVRHNGLTPGEAITAATRTPADLLGLPDRGRLEPGTRADLVTLRTDDPRQLAFEFGHSLIERVYVAGERVLPL